MKNLTMPIRPALAFILFIVVSSFGPVFPRQETQVNWLSMEEAIEIVEAGGNSKYIFVDVYTDWCGWCKRLDQTTFADPTVADILNTYFLPVKFDGEAKRDIEVKGQSYGFVNNGRRGYHELAAAMLQNKLSYPTVVFLDADFNLIQPLAGYRNAEEMAPILTFIGEGHFKKMSWEDYLASLG